MIPMEAQGSVLRKQLLLLLYMYLGYSGFMLLKTSISVISPELVAEGLITKTEWGTILAWSTVGAILGKLLSGVAADKMGGKWTFTLGLSVTTGGVFLFGMNSSALAFSIIFFITLCAKSAGWPSMAKLIGNWYCPTQYGRVWGVLSTSSRVGTITALFVLGALLNILSWRQTLWVAGGIGILLVCASFFLITEKPPFSVKSEGEKPDEEEEDHPLKGTSLKEALLIFAKSGRVWLISISMMGLTILWDFLDFLPLYLKESLKISSADAASITMAFPAGALISVLLGGYFFDKLPRKTVPNLIGAFLALAVICLTLMILLSNFGMSERGLVVSNAICLFIFGFCVSPAYYLPMSIFSIKFGGPHSGILIALLDVAGFGATVPFKIVGGRLADQDGGWEKFFTLLIVIAFISMLVTYQFLRGEAKVDKGS